MRQIVFVLFVCLLLPAPALAEKRIALLIGNQAYNASVGPLKNPHNDIAVVGKALAEVGFKLLAPRKDATRDEMLFAVHELAAQLRVAGREAVSFLYYAGHGVAVGAENVLIPTNAENTSDAMLSVRGVRLGEILDILRREAPDAVHFVVLDACRNTLRGQRGARGFVPVTDRRTGVVIAFSTAQGETATDEGAKSAPYAAALAAEIVKPGRSDLVVFHEVRTRVARDTGQTPWTHDGLVGDRVVFVPALAPGVVVSPQPPVSPQSSEAERAWDRTKDTTSTPTLEAFIRRFGDTFYGDLAKERLADLQRAEAAKQADAAKKKQDDEARAKAVCVNVESILNIPVLKELAGRHKETPAGACIAARIDLLQKQQAAVAVPPAAQPAVPKLEDLVTFSSYREPAPLTPAEERAVLKPKDNFKECDVCPVMVVVPAGSFMMGSPASEPERGSYEGPQRKVTISLPLAVGMFAVTFDEWDACVADRGCNGYRPNDQGWGRGKHPVINVNWDDAKAYASWLSRKTGKSYRLLSEAEREYVTRAGTTTPFWWGSSISPTQANYAGIADPYKGGGSRGEYRQQTVPVDSFAANPWGLFNVHGNVYEWTEDCWNESHAGNPGNGSARTTGDCGRRVVRGGSWIVIPNFLRSAGRDRDSSGHRLDVTGFRLARTLNP